MFATSRTTRLLLHVANVTVIIFIPFNNGVVKVIFYHGAECIFK